LISGGCSPDSWLVGWRKGAIGWSLRAQLGQAAKLTVDDRKTCFAIWKAFPRAAVGAPVRFTKGVALTLPERAANAPRRPPEQPVPAGSSAGALNGLVSRDMTASVSSRIGTVTTTNVTAPPITTTISISGATDLPDKRRRPRTGNARALSFPDD